MKRTVRSDFGEVYVRETGIIHARAFSNTEINLEEIKDYHSMVAYLSESKPHATIIDISGITYISSEARQFIQKQSSEWGNTVAVALVTNSFTAKMIGNFFLTVNKPSYPVKLFRDTLAAQQWAQNEYQKYNTKIAS